MERRDKVLLEVIYKGHACLPCHYMDKAVQEVVPRYDGRVEYRRVCISESREAKRRFVELSIAVYGEEAFRRHLKLAPVPSLFIDGKLAFDVIPPRQALEEAIEAALAGHPPGHYRH